MREEGRGEEGRGREGRKEYGDYQASSHTALFA